MELWFLRFLNKPAVIWILTSRPVSWLLGLLLPWMERNDPLPADRSKVRFIFLISYAATQKGLTRMSYNTTLLAAQVASEYPGAAILFCEFRDNPKGAKEAEWKFKLLPKDRAICAGDASSTTDERELLATCAGSLGTSVVVGNGLHIRRAAMVWEYYHPNADLRFKSTRAKGDDDLNNPMTAQRRWQTWEIANLVGLFFYKLIGIQYFARKNLSQPVE